MDLLREAGRIASAARNKGAASIVEGASVRDVCQAVDDDIVRLGGQPAFPTQSSRNEIAAHYCPSPDDETCYADGDLAKLDVGVHLDGYIVDTATTVNVGDRPAGRPLVEAAARALEAAIETARPNGSIKEISLAIQAAIASFSLRPVRNLCGHGVGRWLVHCPPPIPNVPELHDGRLDPDSVVAIEPFATTGSGSVVERGEAEVFRVDAATSIDAAVDEKIAESIRSFRGLPFSRRQLGQHARPSLEAALSTLEKKRQLASYPPLVEPAGFPVAQAEHSLLILSDTVEVLTR